jgi:molecular chaperone GrpE
MTSEDLPPEADATEEPEQLDPMTALEQERDQFKILAQRTQADFVNYKRRTDEERLMISRMASAQVLVRLLPVIDDLHRAVDAVPENAPDSWADGIRMIAQNLQAIMLAEGVTMYEPKPGETFQPAEHEAVYYQPTNEQPAGAVLSVVRPGYRSGERVLRPAQVVVAQEPDNAGTTGK